MESLCVTSGFPPDTHVSKQDPVTSQAGRPCLIIKGSSAQPAWLCRGRGTTGQTGQCKNNSPVYPLQDWSASKAAKTLKDPTNQEESLFLTAWEMKCPAAVKKVIAVAWAVSRME